MRFAVTACSIACAVSTPARAQAPDVGVTAVPEFASVRPGSSLRIAITLRIPEGWHIGWTNPGPSGSPTVLAWTSGRAIGAGSPAWPYPELDSTSVSTAHVYRGDVIVVTPFHVAPGAPQGSAEVRGTLTWGMCRDQCVAQRRSVAVSFRIDTSAAEASPAWSELEAAAAPTLPLRVGHSVVSAVFGPSGVRVTILGLRPTLGSSVTFFPADLREPAIVVRARGVAGGTAIVLPFEARDAVGRIAGVLVAESPWGPVPGHRALSLDAHVQASPPR